MVLNLQNLFLSCQSDICVQFLIRRQNPSLNILLPRVYALEKTADKEDHYVRVCVLCQGTLSMRFSPPKKSTVISSETQKLELQHDIFSFRCSQNFQASFCCKDLRTGKVRGTCVQESWARSILLACDIH